MVQVKSVFDKYMSSQRKEQKIKVTGHGKEWKQNNHRKLQGSSKEEVTKKQKGTKR